MYCKRAFLFIGLYISFFIAVIAQEEVYVPEPPPPTIIYKGINFIEANEWGEILALAELEDKVIFLDAYTSWCRPCKVMDKDVFSRPDVGNLYNQNFLNVRMNMEKGDGVALMEKYQIIAYPSLLFLNHDGSVIHRATGYKGPGKVLQLGREVKVGEHTVAAYDNQFEEGERSPKFLLQYLESSIEAADGRQSALLKEYLATQSSWDTDEIRTLILKVLNTPDSPIFDHLITNKTVYAQQFGESKVENKIQSLVYTFLRKSETPLSMAPKLFQRAYPTNKAEQLTTSYKMNYYRNMEDGEKYAAEVNQYLSSNKNKVEEDMINEIAWNYYDLVSNTSQLKALLKFVKKNKQSNTYLSNEAQALLYAKMGKTKKARKLTEKAIAIAESQKINTASAEDLLAELEAGKEK